MLRSAVRRAPRLVRHAATALPLNHKVLESLRTLQNTPKQKPDLTLAAFAAAEELAPLVLLSDKGQEVQELVLLLDTCLALGKEERAENILGLLYKLCHLKPQDEAFMVPVVRFLSGWAQFSRVLLAEVETWVEGFSLRFAGARPTAAFVAVLVNKAGEEDPGAAVRRLREWCAMYGVTPKDVLACVDLFSLLVLERVIQDKSIQADDVPDVLAGVPTSDAERQQHAVEEIAKGIAPLAKPLSPLLPTSAFGLQAIRYTLRALVSDPEQYRNLRDSVRVRFNVELPENMAEADFFAASCQIPLEDRPAFNAMLDEFNTARQQEFETRLGDSLVAAWKHEHDLSAQRGTPLIHGSVSVILYQWFLAMLPLVEEELRLCKELVENPPTKRIRDKNQKARMEYAPFMLTVPALTLLVTTIMELVKFCATQESFGVRVTTALSDIGTVVMHEHRAQQVLAKEKRQRKGLAKVSTALREFHDRVRAYRSKEDDMYLLWPKEIRVQIGGVLVLLLMHVAKVKVIAKDPVTGKQVEALTPAVLHGYLWNNGQRIGMLKFHPEVYKMFLASPVQALTIPPQRMPMLVKGRPWTDYNMGGYHYFNLSVLRTKELPETRAYTKAAARKGQLATLFKGLNALGDTAWTVNQTVLKYVTEVWNLGEGRLGISPKEFVAEELAPLAENATFQEKAAYREKQRMNVNSAMGNILERTSANYRMEIARALAGERIFFPHNVDFRGRAYPLLAHLNHLGDDLLRGLLKFWDGKPLGSRGLYWLKVHVANCFGLDKRPFDERVAFVDAHMEQLHALADAPMAAGAWWTTADKPWQALAALVEILAAVRLGDVELFVLYQPVHMDGSCNGLQHYAALGGDEEGARQVNLLPLDLPQDVYAYVEGLVRKQLEEEGSEDAKLILPVLKRKVVKQTVMTNVYGVTFIGGLEQIKRQLTALMPNADPHVLSRLSNHLTNHVFRAIRSLFGGAHLIQDWLGEAAQRVARLVRIDPKLPKEPMLLVVWTLPLGIPCVQPYRKDSIKQVLTPLQLVGIVNPFSLQKVDARAQKSAFPPNFIHSIDASHMMFTALKCHADGLLFALVHDSFWTHAADVDTMNRYIREAFVELHLSALVKELKTELEQRYKDFVIMCELKGGVHPVVERLRKFRREVSKQLDRKVTLLDEMHLEQERRRLLDSDDPAMVEEGRNMETSVSIVEEMVEDKEALLTMKRGTGCVVPVPFSLPDLPEKGAFRLESVKESKYFFA